MYWKRQKNWLDIRSNYCKLPFILFDYLVCVIVALVVTYLTDKVFKRQNHHMDKIELVIIAVTNFEHHGTGYIVVLQEKAGERRLPVVIGGAEAQSIIQGSEQQESGRPLAHDVMMELLGHYQVNLEEVHISELQDHVFHATLMYRSQSESFAIDSRTSDALALAIRAGCPIFTNAMVMDEASVEWSPQPTTEATKLEDMSPSQLQKQLAQALDDEDYEQAARIRDLLDNRKDL